jgi:hypothetical protein
MSSVDDAQPTRTSTAITAVVTAVVVALLLAEAEQVVRPVLVGSVGAACFAASLYVLSADRLEAVAGAVAGVLTVGVAVGVLAGTLGTVLLLLGELFPVENTAAIPGRSLFLLSRLGIVVGCVLAVLGVVLGLRSVVDGETLSAYFRSAVKTGLVPAAVGIAMAASATLAETPAPLGALRVDASRWLLAPDPVKTHAATLALLLAAAALGVRAAVGALPVAELLADSGGGEIRERRVEQTRWVLCRVGGVALVAAPVLFVTELLVDPPGLRRAVGTALYRPLVALSTVPTLRVVLVGVATVAAVTVAVVAGVRWVARVSVTGFASRIGPFVGGGVVTVGAVAVARPVRDGLVAWVAARLPGPLGGAFRESTATFVGFFGTSTVVVLLAAALVGVTATVVLVFRFVAFAGYLSAESAGYSLAAAGLFLGTAFAGTVGASAWLVFGGLVAAFLVWDTGRYGTTLGREIGRRASTRRAELVHAGGTVAVGLVGVGLAYGITAATRDGLGTPTGNSVVALMGVLAGIVFLVAALR